MLRLATALLTELFRYRRVHQDAPACPADDLSCCVSIHAPRLLSRLTRREPVDLILPAFPAKSPSPRKVLGPDLDLAEECGLRYLQRVCDRLAAVYPPGVRLLICSDGRVFSDVVGIRDADVTTYGRQLRAMISDLDLRSLAVFSLDDVYGTVSSYEQMRHELLTKYAEPLERVRQRVLSDEDDRRLFNGIHRFLVEDLTGVRPDWSRTQLRKHCRVRAYQLIQRSGAWGTLLAEQFPVALRLSIHPRHPHHHKIGIRLADSVSDIWITPWHGVALVDAADPRRHRLVPRHQAERLGGRLVHRDGRASHFVLEEADALFSTERRAVSHRSMS